MCLAYSSRDFECFDLNDGHEKDMLRYLSHTVDFRSGTGEMQKRHEKQKHVFVPLLLSHDQIFVTLQSFTWRCSISGVSLSHEKAELEQKLQQKLVTHEQALEPVFVV